MMRGFGWNYYGNGFGLLGLVSSILFWVLIVLFIVAIIRYLNGDRYHNRGIHQRLDEDPLEILKRRYAQGEINKKQFEEIKKDLV